MDSSYFKLEKKLVTRFSGKVLEIDNDGVMLELMDEDTKGEKQVMILNPGQTKILREGDVAWFMEVDDKDGSNCEGIFVDEVLG